MGKILTKRIDAHVHLYPAKTTSRVNTFMDVFGIPQKFRRGLPDTFDARGYLSAAVFLNIAACLNLPVAPWDFTPKEVSALNEYCAQLMADHPGKVFSFGSVNPHHNLEDQKAEIRHIMELKLLGIKLHPIDDFARNGHQARFQKFDPIDEAYSPLYKEIADQGLPIYWHAGSPHEGDKKFNATPPKIRTLIKRFFRNQRMYLAHLADLRASWMGARRHISDLPNVILDFSYTYYGMNDAPLAKVVADVGSERLMFGSDFPYMSVATALEGLFRMGRISAEDIKNILFNNANREFNMRLAV